VIILPYFLLVGRKYPVEVLFYAINLYCCEPEMSQRDAAAATRKEFDLPKFSHSTLCRTLKALEESVSKAENGPTQISEAEPADKTPCGQKRRFPSVSDTASRRKAILPFFNSIPGVSEASSADAASLIIVKYWYEKHRRLLI
jgi:hypothetical protein